MTDQLRYNTGKTPLSYWYSTKLALANMEQAGLCSSDGSELTREQISADVARQGLCAFLLGEVSYADMAFDFLAVLYEDVSLCPSEIYSKVCEFGEKKYARGNFRKGQSVCHYADCALRHLRALVLGESLDKDSGLTHWGHALWNITQIFEIMQNPEAAALRDDRLFHHGDLSGR